MSPSTKAMLLVYCDGRFVSRAGKVRTRLGRPGARPEQIPGCSSRARQGDRHRQDRPPDRARHGHRAQAQARDDRRMGTRGSAGPRVKYLRNLTESPQRSERAASANTGPKQVHENTLWLTPLFEVAAAPVPYHLQAPSSRAPDALAMASSSARAMLSTFKSDPRGPMRSWGENFGLVPRAAPTAMLAAPRRPNHSSD